MSDEQYQDRQEWALYAKPELFRVSALVSSNDREWIQLTLEGDPEDEDGIADCTNLLCPECDEPIVEPPPRVGTEDYNQDNAGGNTETNFGFK